MARRIRRRKVVSHSARTRKPEAARSDTSLPNARPISVTRVLIVAPGPMRILLTSKISGSSEVMLAGVADNEMTTIEKVLTEEADVVAIYIHVGGELVGLDIARNVSRACPQAGILIMVNDLAGIELRRHSRRFGTSWSYAVAENVMSGTRFCDLVQSVGRGIHWIDPELKRVLEAIWQIAGQGRDLEAPSPAQGTATSSPAAEKGDGSSEPDNAEPKPRGVQTMQAGKGGVGSGGFGVSSTDDILLDLEDDDLDEDEDEVEPGAPLPKTRGIQTMQTGKGGIGSGGFGVSRTG